MHGILVIRGVDEFWLKPTATWACSRTWSEDMQTYVHSKMNGVPVNALAAISRYIHSRHGEYVVD